MARITQQSSIHTTGVSYENEPIVRSDGSGEIMQWQPSDGGADGIYIVEGGSEGDPARLGIGVAAPTEALDVSGNVSIGGGDLTVTNGTEAKLQLRNTKDWGGSDSGNIGTLEFYSTDPSGAGARVVGAVQCAQNAASAAPNGELVFKTAAGGGSAAAAVERMRIDSSGNASIQASGADQKRTLNVHGTNGSSELYTFAIEADGENAKTNFKVGSGGGAAATKLSISSTGAVSLGPGTVAVTTLKPSLLVTDTSVGGSVTIRGKSPILAFDVTDSGTGTILTDGGGLNVKDGTLDGHGNTHLAIDSDGDTTLAGKLKLDDASVAGWIQSNGSVRIDIDNDDSSTDRAFVVSRDNGSATLFNVNELGAVTLSGSLLAANGAVDAPSISFSGDTDTGIWRPGSNQLRFVTTGIDRLTINGSGAVSIPSASGTHVALTVKGGNDLVDNIAFNVTNQSGTGVANIRNNGALYASAITSTGTLTVGSLDIGHGAGGATTNTAIGTDALDNSHTGATDNTAVGYLALTAAHTNATDYNTAVGSNAGKAITSGSLNTAIGAYSLDVCETGDDNVAVGANALGAFTGSNATAVGSGAADAATSAANLTAVGTHAAGSVTDGDDQTAVGNNALASCITGAQNTAIGASAAFALTGSSNVMVGMQAGYYATNVDHCVAIGRNAFLGVSGNTEGDYNVAIGNYSLDAATTGHSNVAIGWNTLTAATTNHSTVAVGHRAMESANGGEHQSVAVGAYALNTEASGSDGTVAVGYYALKSQDGGTGNVAVGYNVANGLDNGSDNVFIGYDAAAGSNTPTGDDNVVVGAGAGFDLSSGYRNVIIGEAAAANYTNNHNNVVIGRHAMVAANDGELYNVAIGSSALASETSGADYCVAVGYNAMIGQNANVVNAGVGSSALFHNKSGANNVALGMSAGYANVDSYNTWVGHQSGAHTGHAAANTTLGYRAYFSSTFSDGTCDLNETTTITCDTSADIAVGQSVTGSGIPYGAYVATVNSAGSVTSFTLNEAATTTAANQTLTFYKGTGDSNTCIGYTAGEDLTTGSENVFIGRDAGKNCTTNATNVAIGVYAFDAANGGETSNVAIGYAALGSEASGADYCTAVGHRALLSQNANVKNTAVGGYAGDAITSGSSNTIVGYSAGSGMTDATNNVVVGHNAMTVGNGSNNTCIGYGTGANNTTGAANVLIGSQAGDALTDGPGNVLIGRSAGSAMTTGDYNVAIGYQAADSMTGDSNWNTAIGGHALGAEASGADHCIAIGYNALLSQNDASAINLAIGVNAGDAITDGTKNVLIGHESGSALTDDDNCTAVGYGSLKSATSGGNTAIGMLAANAITSGANNVCVGANAMALADGGESSNVVVGTAALYTLNHDSADNNVAVGFNAGRYYETAASTTPGSATPDGNNAAGSNSIFIGYDTRSAESDRSNEIVIGYTAVSNGSNTITLGNDDVQSLHCADTSISALSDRRIKRDITDNNVGLDFVERLATVNYKRLNPADWPEEIRSHRYRVEEQQELVTPAVEAADAVYEDVVVVAARAAVEEVTETIEHPAKEAVYEDVIIPAVEELKEEQVTQHAREEETEERVVQEAREEITEERIVQEAREEVKGERHKHTETEVTETVTREEIVQIDGKWVKREVSEEVTRTERTPVYEECDLYNEDGTQCMCCVVEAVEAKDAVTREIPAVTEERQVVDENGDGVVDEEGNAVMETVELEPARTEIVEPAVEAVEAVHEPMKHKVPVMEEYVVQAAQEEKRETVVVQEAREEKRETVVVQEAQEEVREMVVVREAEPERTERRLVSPAVPARTEVRVITPAEPAVEEVKERRLVSPAVEAQEAVYKTVTVPADERPDDDDTVRLGLVAQDVQTAMTDAGVEFDLVTKGANGKLAVKYSNLVIPLLKAVQELSAEVKALKG